MLHIFRVEQNESDSNTKTPAMPRKLTSSASLPGSARMTTPSNSSACDIQRIFQGSASSARVYRDHSGAAARRGMSDPVLVESEPHTHSAKQTMDAALFDDLQWTQPRPDCPDSRVNQDVLAKQARIILVVSLACLSINYCSYKQA